MIRIIRDRLVAGSVVLLAFALIAPITASAQDDDAGYSQVRTVHVKASKVGEFIELQEQFKAALEAAGRDGRGVWQEIRGDQNVFHLVVRADNLAQLDTQFEPVMDEEAWSKWTGALAGTISSSTRVIMRRYTDLAIPGDEDAEPNLLLLRYTLVQPGQGNAYRNWLRDQLVPALKAGGASGIGFSKLVYGGNTDRYISSSLIDNWAVLDTPGPLGKMSDEDRAALFEGLSDIVWESEVRVLRFRGDLSHASPAEE